MQLRNHFIASGCAVVAKMEERFGALSLFTGMKPKVLEILPLHQVNYSVLAE
jgi:hypothetical protein